MASTTDQQRQDGLRLPSIDAIPLQDMITESDLPNRLWSDIRLGTDQQHTHEDQERGVECDEQEALLGEDPRNACPVCRQRTEQEQEEASATDTEPSDNDGTRGAALLGRRLARPSMFVQETQQRVTNRVRQSRFHGWRMGVLSGCFMASLVLCCNIALVVVGGVRYAGYDKEGIANLMYGNELTISRWNTALHIFINILSSVLLAGSNYTMQVLSSPTRYEIDRAHARGDWLEIGVLSVRNLRRISRNRAILCGVLAVSSIPLHLFYNASTFKIIANNDYWVRALDIASPEYVKFNSSEAYTKLNTSQWREIYDRPFVSGYGDLYLAVDGIVFQANTTTNSFSVKPTEFLPWEAKSANEYRSISINTILIDAPDPNWIPYDEGSPTNATFNSTLNRNAQTSPTLLHTLHGFAKKSNAQSRIQISFQFMMVVIAFNVFKLMIMIIVLVTDRHKYIVTLGDAAASFLERPEPSTSKYCFLKVDQTMMEVQRQAASYSQRPKNEQVVNTRLPQGWQPQTKEYYYSNARIDKGLTALILTLSLCIVLFVVAILIISIGDSSSSRASTAWLWGASSQNTLAFGLDLRRPGATIFNAWLANMPQVLLSFCYLNLNTLCTAMAGEEEWNRLIMRKGLRVTEPRGEQRSTYFLQLPYKWAVPLITVSTILHWVLSQTFFLIRVDYFTVDNEEADIERSESACGISFASLAAFFGICMLLCGLIGYLARPNLIPALPQIENCSLMISAACHPAPDEVEPHLKQVQWGIVSQRKVDKHLLCSLSSKPVRVLRAKMSYFRNREDNISETTTTTTVSA